MKKILAIEGWRSWRWQAFSVYQESTKIGVRKDKENLRVGKKGPRVWGPGPQGTCLKGSKEPLSRPHRLELGGGGSGGTVSRLWNTRCRIHIYFSDSLFPLLLLLYLYFVLFFIFYPAKGVGRFWGGGSLKGSLGGWVSRDGKVRDRSTDDGGSYWVRPIERGESVGS